MRIGGVSRIVAFVAGAWLAMGVQASEVAAVSPPVAAQMPPNVTLIDTVMQRDALHRLNATSGIRLPRIRVFDGRGKKLLLYVVGWEKNVPARLRSALERQRPLPHGESLATVLAQLKDRADQPQEPAQLPPADVVVVAAWAGWCRPCATAISELRDAMAADPGRRYVLVTVETDAYKQNLLLPGARPGR